MDPQQGGLQGSGSKVAGDGQSLCDQPQPSTSQLLFSDNRSYGHRDRRHDSSLGQSHDICVSSIWDDTSSLGETKKVQKHLHDANSTVLASEAMVHRPPRITSGSTNLPTCTERSQAATLPLFPPEPPRASPHCVETIKRAACHAGFCEGVARQLALCRRKST